MDVCIENVFPAVAAPFNSFHEDAREEKGHGAEAPRSKAIPNIVHVDVDAFFASVEQVLNPKLRGKPVLVGRGVVASASYEAKFRGVKTAMTFRDALRICPQGDRRAGTVRALRGFCGARAAHSGNVHARGGNGGAGRFLSGFCGDGAAVSEL